jgi:hypothetical protein
MFEAVWSDESFLSPALIRTKQLRYDFVPRLTAMEDDSGADQFAYPIADKSMIFLRRTRFIAHSRYLTAETITMQMASEQPKIGERDEIMRSHSLIVDNYVGWSDKKNFGDISISLGFPCITQSQTHSKARLLLKRAAQCDVNQLGRSICDLKDGGLCIKETGGQAIGVRKLIAVWTSLVSA